MAEDEPVVLLVEDNDDDVKLITRALRKVTLPGRVEVARTGVEATAYIDGVSPYDDRRRYPLPALIILDLKMPGIDGYEVLKVIRAREGLYDVPVVVLTAVGETSSVGRTYNLGASVYFMKPAAGRGFNQIAREIANFWRASRAEAKRPAATAPRRRGGV
jgi:CheY-like chemotaxis protein